MSSPTRSRQRARQRSAQAARARSRTTPSSGSPDRRVILVVGAVVAVVLVALVGALVAGGGDDSGDGDGARSDTAGSSGASLDDAPVDVSGAALPSLADGGGDDPAVGNPMPTLSGTALDGTPLTIPTTGRPAMIVFLAHWCPHCQAEVPVVQDWVDGGGLPDGVDLLTVSTAIDSRRPNYPADEWLAREGWTAPVLVDGQDQAAEAAGLTSFPFFVAVDADGNVVARASGELTEAQLTDIAEALEPTTS